MGVLPEGKKVSATNATVVIESNSVVQADETGWWMNGDGRYLHVFGVDDIVIFQVGDRSQEIGLDVLGPNSQGLVVCDGYVGYDIFQTAR